MGPGREGSRLQGWGPMANARGCRPAVQARSARGGRPAAQARRGEWGPMANTCGSKPAAQARRGWLMPDMGGRGGKGESAPHMAYALSKHNTMPLHNSHTIRYIHLLIN